jgi:serine phosphatase RsbU (regulator of sigma subunit)/Tfp pilus assembly protein PilF
MIKYLTLFVVLYFSSTVILYGQDPYLDSLKNSAENNSIDSNRVKAYIALSEEGEIIDIPKYVNPCLEICQKNKKNKLSKQELSFYNKAIASCYNNFGFYYDYQFGDWNRAIQYYLKAIKMHVEEKDEFGEAVVLLNIGYIYLNQNQFDLALSYSLKGVEKHRRVKNVLGEGIGLNNIGFIYKRMKNYDKANEYFLKSLTLKKRTNEYASIANTFINIGAVFLEYGKIDSAIVYYNKSLNLFEKIGNKKGIANVCANLAKLYFDIGKVELANKFGIKSLKLSEELGIPKSIKGASEIMYKIYKSKHQNVLALKMHELFIKMKDSLSNTESRESLNKEHVKYEYSIKEANLKAEQEKRDLINKAEIEHQKNVRNSFLIGFILLGLLVVIVIRSYLQKRKSNVELSLKNDEIIHQNHLIEEKQKEIIDSINYASRIQNAMLTSEEYIQSYLGDNYFIFFQPKDIVSGDFYWAVNHGGYFYMAVSDCTGHGVPGAFMSLLNISFLNEHVIEKNIIETNEVFFEQRKQIVKALNSNDGMDSVLSRFDFNAMKLSFTAANNPLWLVRENELIVYKPDKMPVGNYIDNEKEFSVTEIDLLKGDVIYTFSDGYADQFGGPNGKKFKYKQFQELLLSIHQLPMDEQSNVLKETMKHWIGNEEQIDDILVVGIRV